MIHLLGFKINQKLPNEGDIMKRGGGGITNRVSAIGGGSFFRCSEASEATR